MRIHFTIVLNIKVIIISYLSLLQFQELMSYVRTYWLYTVIYLHIHIHVHMIHAMTLITILIIIIRLLT